jgi:hypothetical protein
MGHGREGTTLEGSTRKMSSRKRSDHGSEMLLPTHFHPLQHQLLQGRATEE